MKGVAQCVVLAAALVCLPASVAQTFPTRPISVVVPLAPGDAADIAARAMNEELSRLLNTPVLAINRPRGGGTVGANTVVQARKDGYTILFAQNSALTFRAVLDPQSVSYDALRDLVPLGIASRQCHNRCLEKCSTRHSTRQPSEPSNGSASVRWH